MAVVVISVWPNRHTHLISEDSMKDKLLKNDLVQQLTTIVSQKIKIERLEARIESLVALVDQINADRDELREKVK